jgi:hypothetical protein
MGDNKTLLRVRTPVDRQQTYSEIKLYSVI